MPDERALLCPSSPVSCRTGTSQRATLVLRDAADDRRDLVRWKLTHGGPATADDFRDPTSGVPSLALCIYDAAGGEEPRLLALIPSGGDCGDKPCWKQTASGGFRMKSRTGDPDGITDLKLRVTKLGELRLLAKGKGAKVALPSLPIAEPVVVQLVIGVPPDTTCWQATFEGAAKNGDGLYKARTP